MRCAPVAEQQEDAADAEEALHTLAVSEDFSVRAAAHADEKELQVAEVEVSLAADEPLLLGAIEEHAGGIAEPAWDESAPLALLLIARTPKSFATALAAERSVQGEWLLLDRLPPSAVAPWPHLSAPLVSASAALAQWPAVSGQAVALGGSIYCGKQAG